MPPVDRPDLPIVATNQLRDVVGSIKDILEECLSHPKIHTIVAVAPFVSPYFVSFLCKTNLKYLVLTINREDLLPNYVKDAVSQLKNVPFSVTIRERPPKSKFVHMKLIIPYILTERVINEDGINKTILKPEPTCAISGSVNWTKNGISVSDEMLVVLRDVYSMASAIEAYSILFKGTDLVYDSAKQRR